MPPKSPKQDSIRRTRAIQAMVKGIPGCHKMTITRDIELVEAMLYKGQSSDDLTLMRSALQLVRHEHTLDRMAPDKRARLLTQLCHYYEVKL